MGYAKKKTFKNSILSALPLLARRSPFQARPEVAIFWDLKSPLHNFPPCFFASQKCVTTQI